MAKKANQKPSEKTLDEIFFTILKFVDEEKKGESYARSMSIPGISRKYITMLIHAGLLIGQISDAGKPDVICLSLEGIEKLNQYKTKAKRALQPVRQRKVAQLNKD